MIPQSLGTALQDTVNRGIGGQMKRASAAPFWELDKRQQSELECSLEKAAKADEFFRDKGD